MDFKGLKKSDNTLIQAIGDNFDQQIFSQNGKLQTHSMALLMTNTDTNNRSEITREELVPQISKLAMTQEIPYVIKIDHYTGSKKPLPPDDSMRVKVPSLATLSKTVVNFKSSKRNLQFLKTVLNGSPEYSA